MPQTYIDIKNELVYADINGYIYSLPLYSEWLEDIQELIEGGFRTPRHHIYILGTSDQFEHIVKTLKHGGK